MAYIIGQYNHNSASNDGSSFITPITSGIPARKRNSGDMGVIGDTLDPFEDECITGLNLVSTNYYYFRGQIKRMTEAQTFTIKLVNYNDVSAEPVEQFIKQIIVQGGDREEWVSVELIFHPVVSFDTILFQLQRTIDDYRYFSRYPKIDYQQLGSINNIIPSKIGNDVSLLKIGVQSHPNLKMCINGEEIYVSQSGIFEIKNGVIPVTFFSVANPAIETTSTVDNWIRSINEQIEDIEGYVEVTPPAGANPSREGWYERKEVERNKYIYVLTQDTTVDSSKTYYKQKNTLQQKENLYKAIESACFFGTPKEYKIDSFALDYMYSNT